MGWLDYNAWLGHNAVEFTEPDGKVSYAFPEGRYEDRGGGYSGGISFAILYVKGYEIHCLSIASL